MIDAILTFTAPNGDTWTKRTVIHRPFVGDLVHDEGLLFRVTRIEHRLRETTLLVCVEGQVKGSIDWELGHERGWAL